MFAKFFKPEKKVRVTLINDQTSGTIGITELTPDQLPASFEPATELDIGDQKYSVVSATPSTADQFIRSGELIIRLTPVEYVNLKDLRYTLPTLSAELPPITPADVSKGFVLDLHEDDWRQCEFLPESSRQAAVREIAAIEDVCNQHGVSGGDFQSYTQLHIRTQIGLPGLSVGFPELCDLLDTNETGSIRFHGIAGSIENGFALKTSNATYYGILENGVVTHLGLYWFNDSCFEEVELVNRTFGLFFVDWCRRTML